jgi:ribosome modulation factor
MTNEQAFKKAAEYPHLTARYFAFYAGRDAAESGDKCEFTDALLRAEWLAGYRDMKGELRLDRDTEWDGEAL